MFPFFIAKRYSSGQGKSSFISIISVGGIALGVAVLIIALTVLDGFQNTIEQKIIRFNSHIFISGFSGNQLPNYKETVKELTDEFPQIKEISPFISRYSIVKTDGNYEGLELMGIKTESSVFGISDYMVEGEYRFSGGNLPGIIVGKKLALKLNIKVGDEVKVLSMTKSGVPSILNPPVIEVFELTGIYESGMAEYDDLRAYIDFDFADEIFQNEGFVSGYNIKCNSLNGLDSLTRSMDNLLGYPHYVESLYKKYSNIFSWLELQKKPIPIVLGLIILVATFNIIGTLLMLIIEKTKDIGILRSMGATKNDILKIFLMKGLLLSGIGIFLGNMIALLLSMAQNYFHFITVPADIYFMSEITVDINPVYYITVSVFAIVIAVLASLIPSRIAAGLNPVNSLRFN